MVARYTTSVLNACFSLTQNVDFIRSTKAITKTRAQSSQQQKQYSTYPEGMRPLESSRHVTPSAYIAADGSMLEVAISSLVTSRKSSDDDAERSQRSAFVFVCTTCPVFTLEQPALVRLSLFGDDAFDRCSVVRRCGSLSAV